MNEIVACRTMQRHQHYFKLQILELIDIETREKEIQGFLIIHEDGLTSYKPVIYPNLIKFNEEVENDLNRIQNHSLADIHASNTDTLLSDIITKLEKSSVMQEKLA